MPLYRIHCQCGHEEDVFRSIAEYDNLPDHCGIKMSRMVVAPMVIADIQPYRSMATGEMIEGRRQHKDHLKRNNLIEIGNEKQKESKPEYDSKGLRETIARQLYT